LIFSVVGGFDPDDDTTISDPLPPPALDISSFPPPRIGLLREYYGDRSDPEVAAAVDGAAATLAKAGALVKQITLPPEFPLIKAAAAMISGSERTTAHARRHATRAADYSPTLRDGIEAGVLIPATYYLQAQRIRRWLTKKFTELFADVDVLVLPTSPIPAPKGDSTGDASFLAPWTFLGYPAGTVPCGLTSSGLPIGMQMVGPPLADYDVLLAMKWAASVLEPLPAPPLVAALA
jgi:aspartyl-tRNA(Asn)/glutamyl-tRNA(Gln) amidotransferase subunit A